MLAGAKTHPKTQHTRKRRYLTVPRICVFGCVAFSGALCSPLKVALCNFIRDGSLGRCWSEAPLRPPPLAQLRPPPPDLTTQYALDYPLSQSLEIAKISRISRQWTTLKRPLHLDFSPAIYRAQNPETPKSLKKSPFRKEFGTLQNLDPREVPKKVRKVRKIVKINYFFDFSDLFRNFLGVRGRGVPNSSRETLF